MEKNEVFIRMNALEDSLNANHHALAKYFDFLASCSDDIKTVALNPFQQDRGFYRNRVVDYVLREGTASSLNGFVSRLYDGEFTEVWNVQDIIDLMQQVKARIEYILDVYKSQPEIRPANGMIRDQRASYIEMQVEINKLMGKVKFYYRQKESQKQE